MRGRLMIRRLAREDAAAYRAIRLAALQDAPDMYGSVHAVEAARPLQAFVDRLEQAAVFGAERDGGLIGLAVLTRADGPKDRHKAQLTSVFVAPEGRGQGVAGALLQGVIAHARTEVEQILLSVTVGNDRALRLYERHGFIVYGREPRATKAGDTYRDEWLMALLLA